MLRLFQILPQNHGCASCGRLNGLDIPHSSGEEDDVDVAAGLMRCGGAGLHCWWRYGLVELLRWCHSAAFASSALNSLAGLGQHP